MNFFSFLFFCRSFGEKPERLSCRKRIYKHFHLEKSWYSSFDYINYVVDLLQRLNSHC